MALCKKPIYRKSAGGLVSCGQCLLCRVNKCREKTFRIMMEARLWDKSWWTTITYNDEFQPTIYIDRKTGEVFENPQGTLHPYHIELFLKRVRKDLHPVKFRYYIVGEYGDTTARPHYHICVFGHGEEIVDVLQRNWTDPVSQRSMGFIDRYHGRPLDTSTARYTVGYTIKKLTKAGDFRLEGRYPEFANSSKGIGLEFAHRFANALKNQSGENYIFTSLDIPRTVRFDGRDWPLDRYLRQKVLECLGISDDINEISKKKFSLEMSSLSRRASGNTQLLASKDISPFMLEKQYLSENAQKILNSETRINLKMKEKPL